MKIRSIAKYSAALAATGVYGAAIAATLRDTPPAGVPSKKRETVIAGAVMCSLTWLATVL